MKTRPNQHLSLGIFATLIFIAGGCQTGSPIRIDRDNDIDFSKYRTFVLMKQVSGSTPAPFGPTERKIIEQSVSETMALLGYEPGEGTGDLQVAVYHERESRGRGGYSFGYSTSYWRRHHHHHRHSRSSVRRHHHDPVSTYHFDAYDSVVPYESEITVDVIDTNSNELIWRGVSDELVYNRNGLPNDDLAEYVRMILARFPAVENRP